MMEYPYNSQVLPYIFNKDRIKKSFFIYFIQYHLCAFNKNKGSE